jgi:S1-C subfamily serine protease
MIRRLVCLFLLALPAGLLAGPEGACVQVCRSRFVEDPHTHRRSKECGWGTGAVVSSKAGVSLVLTNKHVAPAADATYEVLTAGGKVYPAALVAADGRSDLALLRVAADLPSLPVAATAPAAGAVLTQYGFTEAGPLVTRSGRVESVNETGGDGFKAVLARIGSWHGDSGGPLVNAAGELAAVLYGGITGDRTTTLAVRLDEVTRFLKDPEGEARKAPLPPPPPAKGQMKTTPVGDPRFPPPPEVPPIKYYPPQAFPAYVPGFTGSGAGYVPPRPAPVRSYGPGGYFPG